jgi:PAS domain-containing protein
VLSAKADLQSVTDAINANTIYRFMTKPWDDDQLRSLVEKAFHHKELDNENASLSIKIRTANQELAESNRRLQEVLNQKQRALAQGQRNLGVVREALQHVPLPVLAIDDEGVIAFANVVAEELYAGVGILQGSELGLRLPPLATLLAKLAPAEAGQTCIAGVHYEVRWHAMEETSDSRGKIVTLTPATTLTAP